MTPSKTPPTEPMLHAAGSVGHIFSGPLPDRPKLSIALRGPGSMTWFDKGLARLQRTAHGNGSSLWSTGALVSLCLHSASSFANLEALTDRMFGDLAAEPHATRGEEQELVETLGDVARDPRDLRRIGTAGLRHTPSRGLRQGPLDPPAKTVHAVHQKIPVDS